MSVADDRSRFTGELPADRLSACFERGIDPVKMFEVAAYTRRTLEGVYDARDDAQAIDATPDARANAIAADLLLLGILIGRGEAGWGPAGGAS